MTTKIINVRSYESILNDILQAFKVSIPNADLSDASLFFIQSQIWSYLSALSNAQAETFALAAFIQTASGSDLTTLGIDRGIPRTESVAASAVAVFSRNSVDNSNNYPIPLGTLISTTPDANGNSINYETLTLLSLDSGNLSVSGYVICDSPGTVGNVAASTINVIINTVPGIDNVLNPASAFGGIDTESDDEYRARIRDKLANNFGKTTIYGYQQTCEAVPGVLNATIQPGTGQYANFITVTVTSSDTPDGIPTGPIIAAVSATLYKDENKAPADVFVVQGPSAITISVSALVTEVGAGFDAPTVASNAQQNVINYINAVQISGVVRVTDIANAIHDTLGLVDYDLYTPVANTDLANNEKATANSGTVIINN